MHEVRNTSTKLLVKAAKDLGLHVKVLSSNRSFIKVSSSRQSMYIQATSVPLNNQVAARIASNKFFTKKVLAEHDVPILKSWLVRKKSEALKIVEKHQPFPLVLKPTQGSHGDDVYVNIENIEELKPLLDKVLKGSPEDGYLIEKYFAGRDLRVSVVGDQAVAVLERIPAHVIGDGKHTIRQLVKKFNQHPLVGEGYEKPICKIHLDAEAKRILNKQQLTPSSVPDKNVKVFLRHNANISTGGIGQDVTDEIPTKIKNIAVSASQAVGLEVCGVDLLYDDITDSAVVLELNDVAGIDVHHYPMIGQARDVAGAIMKHLFAESLEQSSENSHSLRRDFMSFFHHNNDQSDYVSKVRRPSPAKQIRS